MMQKSKTQTKKHKSKKKQSKKKQSKKKQIKKNITKKHKSKKKQTKKMNLKKLKCSPKPKQSVNDYTCYTNNGLFKLKDLWNARHPDLKIISNSAKEIHKKLSEYLGKICDTESCWLKQKKHFGNVYNDLIRSFAPKMPKKWKKNPNEWLSSIEIINVMKQYERAYKCFEFIGPSPIDFDTKLVNGECVWDELCNFNIKNQIKNGKTKIGIIFNTDNHNGPGEHWISLFINIKTKKIFFFDSAGDKSPPEISVLINRIKSQGLQLNPKIKFMYDSNAGIEHQYGDTECGIYSLYFIIHLLEDKCTTHYLKTHILKDKYMEKFRKIYFNETL
jgi:uncharacterized Rmd1/YagE family protein